MHGAFVGMSRSGKTTLAQIMAAGLVKRGRRVGVFDPLSDPRWKATGAEVVTADPFELLHRAKTTLGNADGIRHWFWEEWGPYLKNHPVRDVRRLLPFFSWLGTSSRQIGHSQWFIGHCWQDLIHVRGHLDCVYAFKQGHNSAALMAEDFARPELPAELPRFPRGKFKWLQKMAEHAPVGQIDFRTRRVKLSKG
jgi:hypothetical protein